MKKIKNGRQIGYGAAGLAIGVIVYMTLSVGAPTTAEVKTTKEQFLIGDFYNGEDDQHVVDEDYTGDVIPLLKYGSYRVTQAGFDSYEANGTVSYGKINPTFFYNKVAVEPEPETPAKDSPGGAKSETKLTAVDKVVSPGISKGEDISKTSVETKAETVETKVDKPSTLESNLGGREIKILEGFNIHTTETKDYDVEVISDEFSKSAVLPLDSKFLNVSSTYGLRSDPFSSSNAFHAGLDISQKGIENANIYAVLGGKVVESVSNSGKDGLGNYVVIDHGKFQTLYGHMIGASKLKVDDVIQAGTVVGNVGSTGRSTGPHLHFEVGVGGVKFDGLEFIINIIDKDHDGKVSTEEVKQSGIETPIDSSHWLYKYM